MNALKQIYDNLQAGGGYGYIFTKCKYPFFDEVLYKTPGGYIGYTHFGSSASENTERGLQFIIENIFECSPDEFVKKYECRTGVAIYEEV